MPPISTVAQTVPSFAGSNRIWVTRVGPAFTSEAGMMPGAISEDQLSPASAERQKPAAACRRPAHRDPRDRWRPPTRPASARAGAPSAPSARSSRKIPCRCRRTAARASPVARDRPHARLQIHARMAVRMHPGLPAVVAEPGGMSAGAGIDMHFARRVRCLGHGVLPGGRCRDRLDHHYA